MSIKYDELLTEMPFKWKVQTVNAKMAICVAYIDARQAMDKLDNVVGPMNWKDEFYSVDGQLFCRVSIYDEDKKEWISKSDTGSESMAEAEKGKVSDAFKRACVKFGIGRFLYSKEMHKIWNTVTVGNKHYPADNNGKRIYDVNTYINKELGNNTNVSKPAVPSKPSGDGYVPTPGRYNSNKGGKNVKYQTTHTFTEETIGKIKLLERDGKKGKDVLKDYIDPFNKKHGTSCKSLADFDTDERLLKLIKFIDDTPPKGI